MTDEEDAALTRAALADADNPPLTDEDFAKMRPAVKAAPEIVARYRGQRGPQKSRPVKTQLTLRLDPDIVEHFKASGPGWTARINEVLRKAAGLKKQALSTALRSTFEKKALNEQASDTTEDLAASMKALYSVKKSCHVDSVNNRLFVCSAFQTGSSGQSLLDPQWLWV